MKKGVPKGYVHNWTYRGKWYEKKIGPGKWRVVFTATKNKKSGKGGPGIGTNITWKFTNVKQTAKKIGKGRYQTRLTGIKKLAKIRIKK